MPFLKENVYDEGFTLLPYKVYTDKDLALKAPAKQRRGTV